ncbi:MAG: ATP-binding protein [Candidatus Jordarchaeaceae archaeon]
MSLGYIHFDRPGSSNVISELLTLSEKANAIFRNKYVKVEESNPEESTVNNTFIGRIIEGPFFLPEEVGRDSAIAQAPILRGDTLPIIPKYYALSRVELLGEFEEKMLVPTRTRPRPKSKVSELDVDIIKKITGSKGNLLIGKLDGYDNVDILLDENDKKILPRNIGIFGTVGSGKSNTAQVLIEESIKQDYAVVLFDVEGEYTNMDKPTKELHALLEKYGLQPNGIKKFKVWYPAPGESSRSDAKAFTVKFETFDVYVLFELVQATEAQERSFSAVVDALEEEKIKLRNLKRGPLAKEKRIEPLTLKRAIDKIFELIDQNKINKPSGYALAGKLAYIHRFGIFDVQGLPELSAENLVVPGQVTVIDVSACSDPVKNIAIVDVLKKIFDKKVADPKSPKTLIVIEEAHTFISRETREKMEATMDMLKIIARRGRKRWLCLCFISQQPAHIPNEIFELCNSRIVHAIKSQPNITALKNTTGGVVSEVWDIVPTLGQGQALVITPQFTHPLIVNIRPAMSERLFVE